MFKYSSPFTKLVLSSFIILVSYLIFFLLGSLFAYIFFKFNIFADAGEIIKNQGNTFINEEKYFQIVQSLGTFVVPPLIIARLFNNNINEYLQLKKAPLPSSVVIIIFVPIFSLPLINFLTYLNSHLSLPQFLSPVESWMKDTEEYAGEITERFLAVSTIQGFLVNLFMIALIPAVGEEFLFRGVLQKIFIEWTKNIHWGIIISALLFSTFHLQFYGFLPRLMLGIFFGYLFVWSGSLWLQVLAHFFNNSVAVFFYFIAGKEMNDKIDTLGAGTFKASDIILLIVSVVLVSAIIILVFRKEKRVL